MRISDWSSDVCSSDLIGAGRAARNLAIPLLAGQPDFEIIGARGREAHVAGAQFHAAESEAELGEQGFGARRHPLVLGFGLVGGGDRDHLDLVELVLAAEAARIAAPGARLRAEAWRPPGEASRGFFLGHGFLTADCGPA